MYTWNAETLQSYLSKGVLFSADLHFFNFDLPNVFKFSAAILEKGLLPDYCFNFSDTLTCHEPSFQR